MLKYVLLILLLATPAQAYDEKMADAIRNGLSLSVSTCFNIFTQGQLVTEQEKRLEICLGRVLHAYNIARRMLEQEVTDAGR